jgi:glyoxylase-like metal-dependent hydrolase (beta-lactamase superfamily II)
MTRLSSLPVLGILALTACTRLTPEQQFIADASAALGGRDRILSAKTLVIEGSGTQYNLGQDVTPGASGQTFTVTGYSRAIDLATGRSRVELTRTPTFAFFQGRAPQKQVQGIDGAVGYNVAPTGAATRLPEAATVERAGEWNLHPLLAIRAALDPMAKLSNPRTEGGQSVLDVTTADGRALTIAIDATTKLPSRVETKQYNVNLGDVVISTSASGYQAVGGLQLPTSLITRTDDFTTTEVTVAAQSIDTDTGDLAAPADAASAALVTAPPPPIVTATPLARGITMLAGGSHHSVLVEFADHLTLIETPLNDARALAVIAKARELVPGKPLTRLVNSHHHFDHSGGVRAAIAEGLTLVTHQGNVPFFEEVAKRPHTLRPDALANGGTPLVVEGVADSRTITDATMTMVLYAVTGPHSESMLVAYFPRERLVVEADVYTPGGAVFMYAAGFLEQLKQRNLRIDRVVPLHGMVATYAQFVKDAAAPLPATN